jgi:hypothetical protein
MVTFFKNIISDAKIRKKEIPTSKKEEFFYLVFVRNG